MRCQNGVLDSTAGVHNAVSSSLHSPDFSTAVVDSSLHPALLFFSVWGGGGGAAAGAGDWGCVSASDPPAE